MTTHAPADPRTPAAGNPGFGRRLRALRHARGVSLRWLAREAGLTHAFVWQMELGRALPSASTLKSLADVLGYTMDELWCGLGRCEGVGP